MYLNYAYGIGCVVKFGYDGSGECRDRLEKYEALAKIAGAVFGCAAPKVTTLWEDFCGNKDEASHVEDLIKRELSPNLACGAEYLKANKVVLSFFESLRKNPGIYTMWIHDFRVSLYRRERGITGDLPSRANDEFVNDIIRAIRKSPGGRLSIGECEAAVCSGLPTDVIEDFRQTWQELDMLKTILHTPEVDSSGQARYKL